MSHLGARSGPDTGRLQTTSSFLARYVTGKIFDTLCTVYLLVFVLLGFHEPPPRSGPQTSPRSPAHLEAVGPSKFRDVVAGTDKLRRIILVDATAWVAGTLLGCAPLTAYVESAVGVATGGRTGITSLVTGLLFLASPWHLRAVALVSPEISGAILLCTAVILSPLLRHIDHSNRIESSSRVLRAASFAPPPDDIRRRRSIPSVLGAILIPLIYSIHAGAATAFILYGILLAASGTFDWEKHHTLVPLWVAAVLRLVGSELFMTLSSSRIVCSWAIRAIGVAS